MFAIVALAALLLAFLVRWLESQGIKGLLVWGIKVGEYSVFLVDLFLFLVFLLRTAKRTLREL